MDIQEQKETQVRRWFSMWLNKQDTGIMDLFAPDAIYIESWGARVSWQREDQAVV